MLPIPQHEPTDSPPLVPLSPRFLPASPPSPSQRLQQGVVLPGKLETTV